MAGLFMAHQPLPVPPFSVHHHVRTLNKSNRSLAARSHLHLATSRVYV
jgi:hypothetical protein